MKKTKTGKLKRKLPTVTISYHIFVILNTKKVKFKKPDR